MASGQDDQGDETTAPSDGAGVEQGQARRAEREALAALHEVTLEALSTEEKIGRMLDIGTEFLGLPYGYVTELDDDQQAIRHARGGNDDLAAGAQAPRSETYCRRTVESGDPVTVVTDAESEMGDDPAYDRFGLSCYVASTVHVDDAVHGTLCFADDEARGRSFTEGERLFVDMAARWIGTELETERQAAELESRQRHLEAVFDTPEAFVGLLEPDGTVIRVNEAARSFVGRDPETFVGEPFWEGPWFAHDGDLQARIKDCTETARDGERAEFQATHLSAEGQAIDVEGTIRPVRDDDGSVDLLVAHGTDVTDRKRRLEQVRKQRERLGTILDNAPLILYVIDKEGIFTESRGAALDAVGLEPGEAVGTSVFEMYDDYPGIKAGVRRALDGEQIEAELSLGDKTFRTYLEPVRDDSGAVQEVIGISQDVTELKTRERELEDWKHRLQTVIENAPMVVFAYEPDGTVTMTQGKGLSAYGLEPDELLGENLIEVYGPESPIGSDARRASNGESVTSVRELDDAIFKTWYRPIERDGEVEQVIGVAIDITTQKRQEDRIAAMSDATNDLIDARSPAAVGETVMGIAEDVLERPLSGIWTYDGESGTLEPLAASERVLDLLDATDAGDALPSIGPGTTEMEAFEAGDLRVVEDYGSVAAPAHPDAPLGTVAFAPLGKFGQLHVGSRDVDPFSEASENLVRILASNAEAALERAERQQELAAYRTELERSNESLQQFAYIASHDLQEPLRMVSSYVDLLEREYAEELDDEADEYIEFAVDGATRMQEMIEALLEYSRVQTQGGEFTETDVETVVAETIESLQLLIQESDAEVVVGDLPTVDADASQLGQVFQNLVENAIEYGADSPRIEIEAVDRGDHYEFAVSDDGPGIPADDRETIFEIFRSGHRGAESSGGTGIGLAVCQRIVHRHDGEIWVDGEPGEGATFRFTIPTTETTTYTNA